MLKQLKYQDYGTITVLINSDEEISSPGSRQMIMDTAQNQDVVLSFETRRFRWKSRCWPPVGIGAGLFTILKGGARMRG